MERVTKELPNGTWKLDGVDWRDVPTNIYGALSKLRDYENTGVSPEDVKKHKEMAKRNNPLPVVLKGNTVYCPTCKALIGIKDTLLEDSFCRKCGQHVVYVFEEGKENADKSK